MKRYKDCALECIQNQTPIELLDKVETISTENGYKIERYTTFSKQDTLAIFVVEHALPYSRVIVCANTKDNNVSIVNIIPMPQSGTSHIGYSDYNKLLNIFRDKVFKSINQSYGNQICENSEDYSIDEIIPRTFPQLDIWLNGFPLSGHPNDEERWYDFVITLHNNNQEHLSLQDFEKYLEERCGWSENTIEKFSLKLESQLDLLNYYDEHR